MYSHVVCVSIPIQTFQLQMLSPSGTIVPPNNSGSLSQVINIANPQKVGFLSLSLSGPLSHTFDCTHCLSVSQQPLRMRIRLSYNVNGVDIQEQGEVNDFPPELVQ